MAVTIDFSLYGRTLVRKGQSDLVELVPFQRYQTPDNFHSGSLIVTVNGLVRDRENDNGYVVQGDNQFELKVPKSSHHYLQVYYQVKR